MNEEKEWWCTFDFEEEKGMIVGAVVLGIVLLELIVLITSVHKHRSNGTLKANFRIYVVLTAWLLHNSSEWKEALKINSSINGFLDFATTFCLLTVMLDIPLQWMSNVMRTIDEIEPHDHPSFRNFVRSKIFYCKIYWKVRLFFAIYPFIALGLSFIAGGFPAEIIKAIIIDVDTAFICGAYLTGILFLRHFSYAFKDRFKKTDNVVCEYSLLAGVCFIRMIYNVALQALNLKGTNIKSNCYNQAEGADIAVSVVLYCCGCLIIHVLPAAIILYTYWVQPSKNIFSNSLIASSPE